MELLKHYLLPQIGYLKVKLNLIIFDIEFRHLPFTRGHANAEVLPKKPETFDRMIMLAEKLGESIPHARIDFYEVNGKTYFGEITFYPASGLTKFNPEEWDKNFGDLLTLPEKYGGVCLNR